MKDLKRRVFKGSAFLGILALAFVGFMGFAHTPAGRPLLMWLVRVSGKGNYCPLGYDKMLSLAERTAQRRSLAGSHAGRPMAPTDKVLDFNLGRSYKAAIESWAVLNGGSCKVLKSNYELQCVGPFFGSKTTTLWLEFNENSVLVSVKGIESYPVAENAMILYLRLRANIFQKDLSALNENSVRNVRELKAGLLRQASVSSDYQHLKATVRITNLGKSYAVTQNFIAF